MRRWFLPETPDLLGLLGRQGAVTVTGMDALVAWSKGDADKEAEVRACEHEADGARKAVLEAVKHAFVTPISPEDAYELTERLDAVLNVAKNLVREADVLGMRPDAAIAEMADLLALGVRDLVSAFPLLVSHPDRATEFADAAVRRQRAVEHVYRRGHVRPARGAGDPRGHRATRALPPLRPHGRRCGGRRPPNLVRGGEGGVTGAEVGGPLRHLAWWRPDGSVADHWPGWAAHGHRRLRPARWLLGVRRVPFRVGDVPGAREGDRTSDRATGVQGWRRPPAGRESPCRSRTPGCSTGCWPTAARCASGRRRRG